MYEICENCNEYDVVINNKIKKSYNKHKKTNVYNCLTRFVHHLIGVKLKENHFKLIGSFIMYDKYKIIKKDNLFLSLKENKYELNFLIYINFFGLIISIYKTKISYDSLLDLDIHTKLMMNYLDEDGLGMKKGLVYKVYDYKRGHYRTSKVKTFEEINTSLYVRQSARNAIYITNRIINKTDYQIEKNKIKLAHFLAFFYKRNRILLFEKECKKYEESASVLFEKLIDLGYKNIYYVIEETSQHFNRIPAKYLPYVIKKHTIKHYIYFFKAKSIIGTESVPQIVDLRIANRIVLRELRKAKFKYVFLQHGIMYMVSLDSKARSFFRKGDMIPNGSKIVVSSKKEADHFVQLANFDYSDLYITGLPKYDRNKRNTLHNKIVVMPTWRPWEYNKVRTAPEETGYYKMVKSIVNNIPEELLDNVIILPHPLFEKAFKDTKFSKYMLDNPIYDEVLREVDTLITDYSSIAYDAFYRGSNVIFCWNDKDECMEKYGGSLMLNEKNVFGDLIYNYSEISKKIKQNYNSLQSKKYINRYKKIVEFSDGKNTERLIEMLNRDKII